MSKYYKEEDLQRALIGFIRETGIDNKPYNPFDYAANVLALLPAIEINEYADKEEAFMEGYAKGRVEGYVKGMASIEGRAEGEWIPKKYPYDWYYPTCSVCGFENKGELNNYCPNCGKKMKGIEK